jgi:hypothetical protein
VGTMNTWLAAIKVTATSPSSLGLAVQPKGRDANGQQTAQLTGIKKPLQQACFHDRW